MSNNRFVFVCPVFNAEETIAQTLFSLLAQSYDNWKIICIDDMSTDKTKKIIQNFSYMLDSTQLDGEWTGIKRGGEHIDLIENTEKCWEVKNVLKGISMCDSNDIVCRIDGDDWLTDNDALQILNAIYESNEDIEAVWTAHRWGYSQKNISGPMPPGVDVFAHPWVSSHLKTFRKKLIEGIPDENFRNKSGDYVKRAGDQAIYLPVLHRAKLYGFVGAVMYHYTINDVPETYQTDDAKYQRNEADDLRSRGYVENGISWEEVISK